ncbi:hypothetical protein KUCAC02_034816, partial [Chaenocephalus aceratus]
NPLIYLFAAPRAGRCAEARARQQDVQRAAGLRQQVQVNLQRLAGRHQTSGNGRGSSATRSGGPGDCSLIQRGWRNMSRLRDRTDVLTRPEFISLNQPPRKEPDPRRRGGGHQEEAGGRPSDGAPNGGTKEERAPEQDCMQLNPSLRGIAINSLLAIDISLSKRLSVCRALPAVDPHLSDQPLEQQHGSWTGSDDQPADGSDPGSHDGCRGFLDYIAMDTYSFPAAHASRAILVSKFLLNHLVLAVPLRILLYLWAVLVGVSRVLLGKHHLSDVGCGFALGFLHFSLVESVWLDASTCQTLLSISTMSWTGP